MSRTSNSDPARTATSPAPEANGPSSGVVGADKTHRLAVRVYFEDTDFSGVVYHARYLHFFERGRSDFLRCIGVRHHELLDRPDPLVFAVREMRTVWRAPARIDDALLVETRMTAAQGARLRMVQVILRAEQVLTTADVEAVCLTKDGRPRRAPPDLTAALAPWISA